MADRIEALTRLATAANSAEDNPAGDSAAIRSEVPAAEPADPQTPAGHFDAFLDSLNSLGDDARLMLTKQMASLVESHGYTTVAREMTGPYGEWPAGADPGVAAEEPESSDW